MSILDPLTGQTVSIDAIRAVARSPRNPHRAYDADGREIPPMTLATMREHGVRSVAAECQEIGCGHAGSVNVDHLPDDGPVQRNRIFGARPPGLVNQLAVVLEVSKAENVELVSA